jgi:hypothetical protein
MPHGTFCTVRYLFRRLFMQKIKVSQYNFVVKLHKGNLVKLEENIYFDKEIFLNVLKMYLKCQNL